MPLRAKDFSFCKQYEGSKRSGQPLAIFCVETQLLHCAQSLRWTVSFTTTLKQCILPTARMPCSSPLVRRTLPFSLSFFDLLTCSYISARRRQDQHGAAGVRSDSRMQFAQLARSGPGNRKLHRRHYGLYCKSRPVFCFALTNISVFLSRFGSRTA